MLDNHRARSLTQALRSKRSIQEDAIVKSPPCPVCGERVDLYRFWAEPSVRKRTRLHYMAHYRDLSDPDFEVELERHNDWNLKSFATLQTARDATRSKKLRKESSH